MTRPGNLRQDCGDEQERHGRQAGRRWRVGSGVVVHGALGGSRQEEGLVGCLGSLSQQGSRWAGK